MSSFSHDTKQSRLPPEIMFMIYRCLQSTSSLATLSKLMPLSKAIYDDVGPLLYESINMSRKNADRLFMGFARHRHKSKKIDRKARLKAADDLLQRPIRSAVAHDYSNQPNNDPNKVLVLGWPDIPQDPVSDLDSDESDIGVLEDQDRYPTNASCDRKKALLRYTKRLRIDSLPRSSLCADIKFTTFFPFPSVTHLSVSDRSIYSLADWQDVSRDSHPFVELLETFRPEHLCLTCVDSHDSASESYNLDRLGGMEVVKDLSDQAIDRLETETPGAWQMGNWAVRDVLGPIMSSGSWSSLKSLNIHNMHGHVCTTAWNGHTRFYYTPSRQMTTLQWVGDRTSDIIDDINESLEKNAGDAKPTFEYINVGANTGLLRDNLVSEDDMWKRVRKAVSERLDPNKTRPEIPDKDVRTILERIKWTKWEDADLCECCNSKEGLLDPRYSAKIAARGVWGSTRLS